MNLQRTSSSRFRFRLCLILGLLVAASWTSPGWTSGPRSNGETCARIVRADVVALDQCLTYNRFGTVLPTGMIYALRHDVIAVDDSAKTGQELKPGEVMLREGKRPRPIVLRVNEGDCLEINFTNLLAATNVGNSNTAFLKTRVASVHVQGLEVVDSLGDDGSWVGANSTQASLVPPGQSQIYRLFARKEGVYYLFSQGVDIGTITQVGNGLFGMVIVEPRGSSWYRSQVTQKDLADAQARGVWGAHGHPVIDYDAVDGHGMPILKMVKPKPSLGKGKLPAFELCRSDLTAIIAGPDEPGEDRWLFRHPGHSLDDNPLYPRSWQPFREFAIIYHDLPAVSAAFQFAPTATDPFVFTMKNGNEAFAINYGSVAIGTEIWANRMNVGPAADTLDAKFEEFFLSSWVGGDPAIVVDIPANAPSPSTPAPAATPTPAETAPKKTSTPGCPPASLTPKGKLQTGPKATAAFYADDPSNVYHSYLNDRVKFRVMHGGPNIVHVHHQHAHQWLRSPASAESKLLDSQTITPGDGFTLEMIYGSGNRNLTPGDSIFHCHFYPHFAGGLWALWRVHDVFESGTKLERGEDGIERPAPGSRALPDGEIARGTPIPAIVPMPAIPMPPVPPEVRIAVAPPACEGPGAVGPAIDVPPSRRVELVHPERDRGKNPGYPFFIPGTAGRRAPQPPLDFARDPSGQPLDGGLPRHIVLNKAPGADLYHQENPYDFSRDFFSLNANSTTSPIHLIAQQLPDDGTPFEQAAMNYHELGTHPTDLPDGSAGEFLTNGGRRRPGAPFADPARNPWNERLRRRREQGTLSTQEQSYLAREDFRDPQGPKHAFTYKAADIQLDVVFNKKGWHYPQQRISSLWEDVGDVLAGRRAPEPLFFRANSGSLVEYWLTNLLPGYYELDDFQVRTPTDIVGQHIHLVKFDVTASDGAANGFNYQDGSYGPDEVRARIDAINAANGLYSFDLQKQTTLTAKNTPFFGGGPAGTSWTGAQTNVQLWYADQLISTVSPAPGAPPRYEDRTLQSVFTHDHFGPSTHQQVGLYAALIIEPKSSSWNDSQTGIPLGGRDDGGPTSWQAMIVPKVTRTKEPEFREFVLEFQDFQLAYDATSNNFKPYRPYSYTPGSAPLPSGTGLWGFIDAATPGGLKHAIAPPTNGGNPQPSIISGVPEPGARVVNYRSEPIPFRVGVAAGSGANPATHDQAHDLAHAYRSIKRDDPDLNIQPGPAQKVSTGAPYPQPFAGAENFDPYTPLLRAYEHDLIHIRALVGAHHEGHVFNIQGTKWPSEPHNANSGYRSNQVMSISEHFEFNFRAPITGPAGPNSRGSSDYLYQASADVNGVPQGLWGLLRTYRSTTSALSFFGDNAPDGRLSQQAVQIQSLLDPSRTTLKVREYRVVAISAADAQGGNANGLVYYNRAAKLANDPNGLVYVLEGDLNRIKQGGAIEPLVLRANAGELIHVTLTNKFNPGPNTPPFNQTTPFQAAGRAFGSPPSNLQGATSNQVGLHPQLLSYDVNTSNAFNVGFNGGTNAGLQTAAPGESVTYAWYAGDFRFDSTGRVVPRPIEFGTVGLAPADTMFQHPHGLVGILIVEPAGAVWSPPDARTTAMVSVPAVQGKPPTSFHEFALVLQDQTSATGPGTATVAGVNYKSEPMGLRFPGGPPNTTAVDVAPAVSNTLVNGDPQTPIFTAKKGESVRFRIIHTGGTAYWTWGLHGHSWQRAPYQADSTVLGHNPLSEQTGSLGPTGPLDQVDVLIDRAGGCFAIQGDYLYRNLSIGQLQNGMWGLFRVGP
jgi:hypothetical protein